MLFVEGNHPLGLAEQTTPLPFNPFTGKSIQKALVHLLNQVFQVVPEYRNIKDIKWPCRDVKFLKCETSEMFFKTGRGILYLQVAMYYPIYYINTDEILNQRCCIKRCNLLNVTIATVIFYG